MLFTWICAQPNVTGMSFRGLTRLDLRLFLPLNKPGRAARSRTPVDSQGFIEFVAIRGATGSPTRRSGGGGTRGTQENRNAHPAACRSYKVAACGSARL